MEPSGTGRDHRMKEPLNGRLLDVLCWKCDKKFLELAPGGSGWALKICSRCKRRNLVDLATGETSR